MMRRGFLGSIGLGLFAALVAVGCSGDKTTSTGTGTQQVTGKGGSEKQPHDHSGWWCDEHGIPEAECSMCSKKVATEFKKKGDWCDKHDRALSQCFLCKPEQKEVYAAKYRAKYGKEPPPTEDDEKKAKEAEKDKKDGE